MVDSIARKEAMLFQYGTTHLTDYQLPQLSKNYVTVYKEKKKSTEKKPVGPLKDTHTMSNVKCAVPFDLMIKRKDIIRTHPMMRPQKVEDLDFDAGLEDAIRTRPRLVMTPAVAMDDIPDKRARDILVADTYASTTSRALQQAVKPYVSVKAPLVGQPAPATPVTLPSLQVPMVPLEWRMETITWDGKQLRGYTDPDRVFWLDHQKKMQACVACEQSKVVKNQRDLERQLKMNAANR